MVNTHRLLIAVMLITCGLSGAAQDVLALDAPHNTNDAQWSITCSACHYAPSSLPTWATLPTTTDNTTKNNLCMSCHSASGMPTADPQYTDIRTHSAGQTGSAYWDGGWSVECVVCHSPHFQQQSSFRDYQDDPGLDVAAGTITAIATAPLATVSSLSDAGKDFVPNAYVGYLLVPNTAYPARIYRIRSNDATTLTVDGAINPLYTSVGKPYAIRYGKLINAFIKTPNSGTMDVRFLTDSGPGSFATSSDPLDVDSICQICHTQTASFNNSGVLEGPGHPVNAAGTDCTQCHAHKDGFKPNCGNCHTAPPATGKHAIHASAGSIAYGSTDIGSNTAAYGFSCGICHSGSHMNTGDQTANPHTVEVNFAGIAVQDPASGSAIYAPASHSVDDPGSGWTFNYSDGTCSSVYCHGNYPGSGKSTVVSFNTGTAPCGSCHNASNTAPPSSGTHAKHLDAGLYGFRCTLCHAGIVEGSGPSYTITDRSRHVSGSVDWQFDAADPRTAGGSYSIVSGSVMPSDGDEGSGSRSYGTCAVYCHSNIQPDGGIGSPSAYAAPQWGTTFMSCGACHGSGSGHDPAMSSGSHAAHLAYDLTVTDSYVKCVICHTWDPSESLYCTSCHNFSAVPEYGRHANYAVDIAFDTFFSSASTTYSGTPAPGDGYGSCSNTYCHGNGTSVATGTISASTTSVWGTVSLPCTSCHGYPPGYGNGSPKANSHAKHDEYTCSKCHATTTNDGSTIASRITHVDRQFTLDPLSGKSFTYVYAPTGGSCSDISCHAGGKATWGGTVACGSCHAATAATLTSGSHMVHLSTTVSRGPNGAAETVTCDTCHGTGAAAGTHAGHGNDVVNFADGNALGATGVCDGCHSPGGDYDGVADAVIGAKPNWGQPVYSGSDLTAGKEKWCAGCHDKAPSVISAVSAPNVIGDESGAFAYGTGWGFYETGHGLSTARAFPSSGGAALGAGLDCGACHDLARRHIDGNARTYSASSGTSGYRDGYRLRKVDLGSGPINPMEIPWTSTSAAVKERFALCSSCHDPLPFLGASSDTNLNYSSTNYHAYHIGFTGQRYDSDWSGVASLEADSRINCTVCHNVHGSTRLAMVNDGGLVGIPGGLQVWYYRTGLMEDAASRPPVPDGITLIQSTGLLMYRASTVRLCSGCHTNDWNSQYPRSFPLHWEGDTPALDWTREASYEDRAIHTDRLFNTTENVPFRITYFDPNNDAPVRIELWIDRNDDGIYSGGTESVAMVEDDPADVSYTDGKIYAATVQLTNPGDNNIRFRIYATDGLHDAVGQPTEDQLVVWDANLMREVPGEYPTIQDAIDAAYGGNTILVSDGTYTENIAYDGKDLVIRSVNGESETVIRGTGSDAPVVSFSGGETAAAVLDGFTIDNADSGTYYNMNGIRITNGSTPLISNSTITGNSMRGKGAGILIDGGAATIDGCTISGNGSTYESGGGVYIANGTAPIVIADSSISGNTTKYNGGGLYVQNSTVQLTNVSVTGNRSTESTGGGVYFTGNVAATIAGGSISGNTSRYSGAGLYFDGAGTGSLSITGAVISSNLNNTITTSNGGGLYLANIGSVTTISTTTIISNHCMTAGGGIYASNTEIALNRCIISGNRSNGGTGGIGVDATAVATITNCMITGNITGTGYWNAGGGIASAGTLNLYHCTVAGNWANRSGGGVLVSGGAATIDGSLLWDNMATDANTRDIAVNSGTATVTYSAIRNGSGYGGSNNITAITAPVFIAADPATSGTPKPGGDYHLRTDAVEAIDSADPASPVTEDFDGDPRPLDGPGSGGIVNDRGADEVAP